MRPSWLFSAKVPHFFHVYGSNILRRFVILPGFLHIANHNMVYSWRILMCV